MKKKKKIKNSSSPSPNTDLKSSDFHTEVARIAVAQICQSVGYRGAQTSALETLTDVAVRYLRSVATSAATSAVSTGRTQCNLLDIVRALEGLHSDIGFRGNSDPKSRLNSLSDSSILRDTMKFVYRNREIPFSKPLPRRCRTLASIQPCFSDYSPKWNHIPRWLPEFPNINTGGEKPVVAAANEGEIALEKKTCSTTTSSVTSKLPEKRKKVRFKISAGGGGGGGRNEIESELGIDFDLRSGVCKGGKRISFQICDDENFINASSSSSDHDAMKKKLDQSCSRTKMIMMH